MRESLRETDVCARNTYQGTSTESASPCRPSLSSKIASEGASASSPSSLPPSIPPSLPPSVTPSLPQMKSPTSVAHESEQVMSGLRRMRQMLERENRERRKDDASPVVADLVLSCDFGIVAGRERQFQVTIHATIY